jgi:shikimate dehydrogenase
MVDALRGAGVASAAYVSVLGAGGTARSALAASRELGARSVTVFARRAAAVDQLRPVADALGLALSHVDWSKASSAPESSDVVISTVPSGVADPLAAAVHWGPSTVLFDVLYHPWPTPLAASASAAGCRVVSGLELLLAQAARQFELFTGVAPPVDAMRAALLATRRRT